MELKLQALLEELDEVESLVELDALLSDLNSEAATACYAKHAAVVAKSEQVRVKFSGAESRTAEVTPTYNRKEVTKVVRPGRKYKLLSTDVKWSTKPQVHAIMAILSAHMNVGDVVAEEDIVAMMVANEHVLATRQGGKRIWDYYKGNSADGLRMHGNVERI